MTPEEFELVKPLVDVQPVYNLMLVVTAPEGSYDPELKAFACLKLRKAEKQLRTAAKYIRDRLGKNDADLDRSSKEAASGNEEAASGNEDHQ